uniref:Uncharacterized protein n=1 Tax=Laticauda laticaudata TaxID=8630 RepID=A0A8C5RLR3_LATLA
ISYATPQWSASNFLEAQKEFSHLRLSNNRSVMPLDVWGSTATSNNEAPTTFPKFIPWQSWIPDTRIHSVNQPIWSTLVQKLCL